jgi:hypothetical protein
MKMHWKKWLKIAMLHQLCIINWPIDVKAPSPLFDMKRLSAHALSNLVRIFIQLQKGAETDGQMLKIVRWSDGE